VNSRTCWLVFPLDRIAGTEATTQNRRGEIDDRRHWVGARDRDSKEKLKGRVGSMRDRPALGTIQTRVLVATGARRLHDGRQRLTHRRIARSWINTSSSHAQQPNSRSMQPSGKTKKTDEARTGAWYSSSRKIQIWAQPKTTSA
jgi:hypothetical protein